MAGGILNGEQISDLSFMQDALFDKIINLRFRRSDEKGNEEFFTLRSDYEIIIAREGDNYNYHFEKCQQKPSIRVQYTQVCDEEFIAIKIYVTNLHFFMNNKSDSGSYSASQKPITDIDLQMGYFNQFAPFSDTDYMKHDPKKKLEMFRNLEGHNEVVKTIRCRVLGVYPVKLPPDGVTLFDCKVGSLDAAYHSQQSVSDTPMKFPAGTKLKHFLFQSITKRFTKQAYAKGVLEFEAGDNGSLTGPLTDGCANKYGVQVFCTRKVADIAFNGYVPALPQFDNVESALTYFTTNYLPNVRYYRLYTGDFLMFHARESLSSILASDCMKDLNDDSIEIPAIKSITYGGTRSISCPFFGLFHPFQQLSFFARYNLANLVGYYYQPESGKDTFLAIQLVVDFSTTGNENSMEIMSVDKSGDSKDGNDA